MKSINAIDVCVITTHLDGCRTLLMCEKSFTLNLILIDVVQLRATCFSCESLSTRMALAAQINIQSRRRGPSRQSEGGIENTWGERNRKIKAPARGARMQLSARGFSRHPRECCRHTSNSDVSECFIKIASQFRSTTREYDRSHS